jgi:hypothetical protein
LLLTSYKILSNILVSKLTPYVDEIIWGLGFDVINQLLIRFFAIIRYWRKCGRQRNGTSAVYGLQESL